MKNVLVKHVVKFVLLLPFVSLLFSCTGDDYVNAIPGNSTVVVSIDLKRLGENNTDGSPADKFKTLLKVDDVEECGIDLSEKTYLFETVDGNLGVVAKVADDDDLDTWLNERAESGFCKKTSERKDCRFTVIQNSWVAGFSSNALMIIGPVLPAAQAEVVRFIMKSLGQDEEMSIKASPLFDKLDTIDSPIAFVGQSDAFSEKFTAPLTFGAPKDADASRIMIAAGVESHKGFIEIKGEPFSFNANINKSLKDAYRLFRPITERYLESMPSDAFMGAFMNVDGKQFIELLHSNKAFQTLLTGANIAVDMDKIIRSIDGDIAIVMPRYNNDNSEIRFAAKLGDKDFLNDIGYWKKSCPLGSRITDEGKDTYCFKNGGMTYYFGVSDDMQYFSGNTLNDASQSIIKAQKTLPQELRTTINGSKISLVFNVGTLFADDKSGLLSDILTPFFGNVGYILYNVR